MMATLIYMTNIIVKQSNTQLTGYLESLSNHPQIEFVIKATFSVHKLIPKNVRMTTLYTNSLYITFTMIYYIGQE